MSINNPGTPINNEFPELSQNRPLYWLKPTDTVADLDFMMDEFQIRHVPIIDPIDPESDEPRGELKTVISKTDIVKILTPPYQLYPPEFPLTPQEEFAVAEFSKDISAKRLDQIPEFLALMGIPVKTLFLRNSTVGDVFYDLINPVKSEGTNFTRRYRTLCVYGDKKLIVGTISYTDVLRKINHTNNAQFTIPTIFQHSLFKTSNNLTLLTEEDNLLQARTILKGNSFTHIPITTPDGRFVTGIVDDVIVNTFLHKITSTRYSKLPLKHIMLPLNEGNSVSPGDRTSKVIETFVPPNSKDRPTALVVCTKDSDSGKFTLDGIISYTDIFRGFQNWANPPKFPTPKPENKVQDN
jgi:CBS domain-containing protein